MDDDLKEHFLQEGRELVQSAADDLASMITNPNDIQLVDRAFRAIHTLKGSTGLFDLAPMGAMLHAAEDLLDAIRRGTLAPDRDILGALLSCVDQSSSWLDIFDAKDALPDNAAAIGSHIQSDLRSRLAGTAEPSEPVVPISRDAPWIQQLLKDRDPESGQGGVSFVALRYTPNKDCFFAGDDPIALVKSIPGLCALTIDPREPWATEDRFDLFACNLMIGALSEAPVADVRTVFRLVADQVELVELGALPAAAQSTVPADEAEVANRTLRVDANRVDALGDLADDITVATNALTRLAADARGMTGGHTLALGILAAQAQLDRLGGSLHRAVMRMRLVPLSMLFRRFPRLARDIAAKLDKDFDLVLRGEMVEVDKSVVDGLFEPLLHLLRNAADHGIETSSRRRETGKTARASVIFNASRIGDQVVIDVSDDGRGMDPAAIRRTARERALVAEDVLDALTDDQALDLVFRSGFSTAATVTDISGRGVGMDAVRVAVAKLGGRVTLTSKVGVGTTVRLALPVTMLMTDVIVVSSGDQQFGVPMDTIVETIRISRERVTSVRHGRAFVLRDRTIPILDLSALLGLAARATGDDLKILIIGTGDDLIALAVDTFGDRLKLLLRPMSGLLAGMAGMAGTALLGDGSVLLILDPRELIG